MHRSQNPQEPTAEVLFKDLSELYAVADTVGAEVARKSMFPHHYGDHSAFASADVHVATLEIVREALIELTCAIQQVVRGTVSDADLGRHLRAMNRLVARFETTRELVLSVKDHELVASEREALFSAFEQAVRFRDVLRARMDERQRLRSEAFDRDAEHHREVERLWSAVDSTLADA
jgi:hypothetical protein